MGNAAMINACIAIIIAVMASIAKTEMTGYIISVSGFAVVCALLHLANCVEGNRQSHDR